jgi:hypothetical protein
MAKSKRRKQASTRRDSARAQQRRAAQQEKLLEDLVREAELRLAQLRDPATSVESLAALLRQEFGHELFAPGLATFLADARGSVAESQAVAEALARDDTDHGEPSMLTLTFGAEVAHLMGDYRLTRQRTDEALRYASDAATWLSLAAEFQLLGCTADAIDIFANHVTDSAYLELAAVPHSRALEDAHRHLTTHPPSGQCPCGSGRMWTECCRAREAQAVERFQDRSGLYALRAAVADYVRGSAYGKPVARHVQEWLNRASPDQWDLSDPEPLERLATEHAWISAGATSDEADDSDNVLTAFASDPNTPLDLASRAEAWAGHVRYGLWQVPDPTRSPGVPCMELCTGQQLYIAFAPEQRVGMARWCVLLGAVVPIDGAWRATGTMLPVSPSEADALCESVQAGVEVVVNELSGRYNKRASERFQRPPPFGFAEPHNVYVYDGESAPLDVAGFVNGVIGSLLPRMIADLHSARTRPPALTNTEGHAMRFIKAKIAVRDVGQVKERLTAHPDFEQIGDDELTWLGRKVPEAQRQTMLAELRAQLQAEGYSDADLEVPDGGQRWVRGQLTRRNGVFAVELNSRERLDALLKILREIGADPTVVDESHVDPMQDLPLTGGHPRFGGGFAPPEEGWERQWLDERIPALRGRTPREAAKGSEWPPLEGLLRELEYDADLFNQQGLRGVDTDWLREQLDMPAAPVMDRPSGDALVPDQSSAPLSKLWSVAALVCA